MKVRFIAAAAVMALLSACASTGSESEDFSSTTAEKTIGRTARDRIYFGFDKATLTRESIQTLKNQAQYLKQNAQTKVTIEGHTDDRGTREYNIGLGEKRANAVKNYLRTQGIDASRIKTISYGKERPAVVGNNEEAWSQNRRAVTVLVQD